MINHNRERIIMRHILEVRLKRRMFSFFDFKGEMLDFLVSKLKAENIRVSNNGTRIDVASKDFKEVFFFSLENFGFQIEASTSFDDFRQKVDKILDCLNEFEKYKIGTINRIGTRSIILYHRRGDTFETAKNIFRDKLFADFGDFQTKTNTELSDVAYFFDVKKDGGIANIQTGPVTKDEAIAKYFDSQVFYKDFDRNNGFLFSIDFAPIEEKTIDIETLKTEIDSGISNVEAILTGLKAYLSE